MISIDTTYWYPSKSLILFTGKARRLKQAKEEAQDEIEKYRQERERQFKEFEAKVIYDFE
jgi:Vacuolar (H+)-ATPase G subunit